MAVGDLITEDIATLALVLPDFGIKPCNKCGKQKLKIKFAKRSASKDGRSNTCQSCHNGYCRTRYQENFQYHEAVDRRNKRYSENGYYSRYHRQRRYGITDEEHALLYLAQGGKCKICGTSVVRVSIHTDHNHKTKILRGLLCHNCNVGIGHFKEDVERMQAAIEYLKESA